MIKVAPLLVVIFLGHCLIDAVSANNCQSCNNQCNEDTCCTTTSCNNCVQECSSQCTTGRSNCRSNCVTGCVSTCQTQSCSTQTCGCIANCCNRCSNQGQCVNDCAQRCNEPIIVTEPTVVELPAAGDVNVNNTNIVNLTTHINLNNIVHNHNNISVPVYVNTSTVNKIMLWPPERDHDESDKVIIQRPQLPIVVRPPAERCCTVQHPRHCFLDRGRPRCVVRQTMECSSLCTSQVIAIQPNPEVVSQCHPVQQFPYSYCGRYERRECGQCYSCGNIGYNPRVCSRREECHESCRSSMPSCVQQNSGLNCF